MFIEFRKLTLHNFMSFGHTQLDFQDRGFIRVTGVNQNPNDLAISNGSGKSSLWEGIVWAITGDTIRGTKHISNLYGEDGTFVELDFCIDKDVYKVIRSKDHTKYKTSLQIFLNGQDVSGKGLRDSEKLLSQYLPDLTASMLGSVIILGQGLPQKFTNNSPSGRKELLEQLSKSDFMIEDLKKRVAERRSELDRSVRSFEDTILQLVAKKEHLTTLIENSKLQLSLINCDEWKQQLETVRSKLAVENSSIEEADAELLNITADLQHQHQKLTSILEKQNASMAEIASRYEPELVQQQSELVTANSEKAIRYNELKRIEQIKDVCPTCKQSLPDVHKPDTTELRAEYEHWLDVVLKLQTSIDSAHANKRAEEDAVCSQATSEARSTKQEIQELQTKQSQINSHIAQSRASIRTLSEEEDALTTKISTVETMQSNYRGIIETSEQSIIEIDNNIMYNNNDRDALKLRLEVISKFETALKRDFRGYLLSNIIEYIQQRAKEYSKVIFDTEFVEFKLDGNNIDINYMNKPYENLSGGEKQKLDLIIQFSIRDMLSTHLNFTSNIIVLDEVFDGLDMIGCQKVLDVISGISDIKNIFIVTHRKDLSIPTDTEVVVVKSAEGISEIQ